MARPASRRRTDPARFLLRLDADLHRELRLYAAQTGASMNAMIITAVKRWWQKNKRRPDVKRFSAKMGRPRVRPAH